MASGIYEIVNLKNGKRYVGSAADLDLRWRQHRARLRTNTHHSRHLQSAWNKHGEESYDFRVLIVCRKADLIRYEQAAMDALRPEYNVAPTAGSSLGRRFTDETKAKIAARGKGRKVPPRSAEYRAKIGDRFRGRAKSPEHLAALQAGRARRVYTAEQRANLSEKMKQAYAEGRRSKGRSSEYREKIAAALRGRKASPEHRANQAAAQTGSKRGPYKLDPAKAEARREAGRRLAAAHNQKRREARSPD